MDIGRSNLWGVPGPISTCRLIIRKEKSLAEIMEFVTAGLEIGQQVIAMAGPTCLKELARSLSDKALRPESLLHNGRLVFLTAPICLSELSKPGDPMRRGPLHRKASLVRWVSDWSWAYANGAAPAALPAYQRCVHDFIRSLGALSLCTVHCERMERGSLLAILADHRRAARVPVRPASLPSSVLGPSPTFRPSTD